MNVQRACANKPMHFALSKLHEDAMQLHGMLQGLEVLIEEGDVDGPGCRRARNAAYCLSHHITAPASSIVDRLLTLIDSVEKGEHHG